MSISDLIVVMKEGVVQQIGRPQEVYDDPANLFVAKFLGNPPINVFDGEIRGGALMIGGDVLLRLRGARDGRVQIGIRPEGFILREGGALKCALHAVEVMGRDVSVVARHAGCQNPTLRAIIDAEHRPDAAAEAVAFDVKPAKLLLFSSETGARIPFEIA